MSIDLASFLFGFGLAMLIAGILGGEGNFHSVHTSNDESMWVEIEGKVYDLVERNP